MGIAIEKWVPPQGQRVRVLTSLVTVILLGLALHEYGDRIEWLNSIQLRAHAVLSSLDPRIPRVQRVTLAEVDDATFWSNQLGGQQPVSRRFLAEIVRIAVDAKAVVIALDLQLKSPFPERSGDYPERHTQEADRLLLAALQYAALHGVPVVWGCGLVRQGEAMRKEPGIFPPESLPALVKPGYLNLPTDMRTVPLQTGVLEEDRAAPQPESEEHDIQSFALQVVGFYEEIEGIQPSTRNTRVIARALSQGNPVFGGFLKPSSFPRISALDLANRQPGALSRIRNRIVIIGGTWHQYSNGIGPLIESFETPVGRLPGLYIHANYVEALLDSRVKAGISWPYVLLMDLTLGTALIFCFRITKKTTSRLSILILFAVLLALAYFFPVNLGLYLDFVLPLALLVVHLGCEHYVELRHRATYGG